MTVTLYGIRNCDTMRKARAWLDAQGIPYAFHDYKTAGAPPALVARFAAALGWERLLNRGGTTYRGLPDADKAGLDAAKALALMSAHPSLIRRPVLDRDGALSAGFDPDDWAARFAAA
jgi:Spx/MgsR family transcriptional regulator